MKKVGIISAIVVLLVTMFVSSGCERIDAGHVGIRVNLYGDTKGVSDITEVTGTVFYNPLSSSIYEFPVFVQHVEYTNENSFTVNSKDGSEFSVSPILNYKVAETSVPKIFSKYRKPLDQLEQTVLKTYVFDAFRIATNTYTADELISNREQFEAKVRLTLISQLEKEGFQVQQFTTNIVYPATFKAAIEAKNNAVQAALMAENKVKQAEADAKIKVATAKGNAEALITEAEANAKANNLLRESVSPALLQKQLIEKWNGQLPTTTSGNVGLFKMLN